MKNLIWHEKEILKGPNCHELVSNIIIRSDISRIQSIYEEFAISTLDEEGLKFVWLVTNFLVWEYLRALDFSYKPVFGFMYFDLIKPVINHFGYNSSRKELENSLNRFLDNDFNQILLFRGLENSIEAPLLRKSHFKSFKTLSRDFDTSLLDIDTMIYLLCFNTFGIANFYGFNHPRFDELESEFLYIKSTLPPRKLYSESKVETINFFDKVGSDES